jgi:hypothetical protein
MCAGSCGTGKRAKQNSARIRNLNLMPPARVAKYVVDIIDRDV